MPLGIEVRDRFKRRATGIALLVLLGLSGCGFVSNPPASTQASASTNQAKPAISSTSPLPSAQVGAAYQYSFVATGGSSPYTWSVVAGTLAPGLTLSGSGSLSGTPTEAGAFSFTVQVQDSGGQSASGSFSITVLSSSSSSSSSLAIQTSSLPGGTSGVAYSASLQASGGTTPYSWSLASGQLPPGLSLATSGQISGTPSASGSYSFTAKVTDSSSSPQTATASLSITIAAGPLAVTTSSLPAGTVGVAYSATLEAGGGITPYSWSISSGQLPAGLSLAMSGQISGTPSASGSYSFTAKVTDSSSSAQTATASLSITISGPALGVIPASVNFGNVPVGETSTQSIKLTNSGTETLTVSQATITGSTFSMSGLTLPLSLTAGQSTYFSVAFSPTAAGGVTGNVSLVSNDPSSPTNMALSGSSHWVTLSWIASSSTVVGYNVYRSTQSGSSYTQLNSTAVSATTFNDSSVDPGKTYYYVVTAVDSNDVESVYSNQVDTTVPSP